MSCDFCGKVTDELKPVWEHHQTKNCKMVCDSCGEKISRKKDFYMHKLSRRLLKRWIKRNMK